MTLLDALRTCLGRARTMGWSALIASSVIMAGPPPLAHPNIEFGTPGTVTTVVRLADGSTLIGGDFTRVDGQQRRSIAKLAPDGSLDASYIADTDATVQAIVALPDGRALVAGNFLQIDGQAHTRLAMLDANGNVDPSFQANNAILNGRVWALALSPDNTSVYVGGQFNASGYNRLAKFSIATGQPDPNFQIAFTSGSVRTIIADAVAGIYIGGNFLNAGGDPARDYLARVNDNGSSAATVDASFAPTVNNSTVLALAVESSSLYVGGTFTSAGSPASTRNFLAKFNRTTGVLDAAWNPNPNGLVRALRFMGTSLVVGGDFATVDGLPRTRLARVDLTTGAVSATWVTPNLLGSFVIALDVTPNSVVAVGNFSDVGASDRLSLAEFSATDATLQPAFDAAASLPGGPLAALKHPDGSLWVGGSFVTANGQTRKRLVRLNADGSLDATVAPIFDGDVTALAVDSQQRVYAVGRFSQVNGQPHASLARFASNGMLDDAFTAGLANNLAAGPVYVYDIVFHEGSIYVCGNFLTVGVSDGLQSPAAYVAKLDTVTGLFDPAWTPVIPAPTGKVPVQALAVDPVADALFIGGGFTSVDSVARLGVAKLSMATGELDPTFIANVDQVATGQNGDVWALAHADGRVYIGGFQFSSVNGTTGLNILARVSASSGAADAGWNAGLVSTAYIETLAVESNTRLLAAGNAVRPGGGAVARYRLDAGSIVDGAFAPVVNGFGIGVMYDPVAAAVVLTGSFSLAENEPRSGLAAFQADYEAVFGDGFED